MHQLPFLSSDASMVTQPGKKQLDEAHCLWALCQHPCCWETELWIAKGSYRCRVKTSTDVKPVVEESFPSLTVVNVSLQTAKTLLPKDKTLYKGVTPESESHRTPRVTLPPLKYKLPSVKITNKSLPPISSQHSSFKHNDIKEKVAKLHEIQINPQIGSKAPCRLGSLVFWIPNPNYTHVPLASKSSSEFLQYSIKDLTCFPVFPIQTTRKCKTWERKNKVWFKHTCSSRAFHSRGQKVSVSPNRNTSFLSEPDSCRANKVSVKGKPQVQTERSSSSLMKKPIILDNIQERGGRSRRVSKDAPTSPIKIEAQWCPFLNPTSASISGPGLSSGPGPVPYNIYICPQHHDAI